MPYSMEYVEPEVFCEIAGVSIYYLYRNDDADCPLSFNFSTTPDEDNIRCQFDVREVAAQIEQQNPDYVLPVADPMQSDLEWTDAAKQQVIAEALHLGLLPFPDKFDKWWESFEEPSRRYVTDDLPDHDLPDG